MYEFTLTEEQKAIQTMVREFVEREVVPRAAVLDAETDPVKAVPWDIIKASNNVGLRHLTLRKELGGAGQDSVTTGMAVEELGRGDIGVSVVFAQHWKFVQMLQDEAKEKIVQRYLIPLRNDPVGMMAIGIKEPGSGSDHIIPWPDPKAGPQMSAVRQGDHVVINGMKEFISNGFIAHLYIICCRTDRTVNLVDGMSAFAVPRDLPGVDCPKGFTIGRAHDKIGERLAGNAELIFENCKVPMENMLWEWNTAWKNMPRVLRHSNAYAGASTLGVGWAAFEKALEWSKTRIQGCVPIIEHANIAIHLGEMYANLRAAQLMVRMGCWQADNPEHFDPFIAKSVKSFCSIVSFKAATEALQMHGGYGAMKEVGVEKLLRDSVMFLHSDGANDSLYRGVGMLLGKLPHEV